MVKRSKGKNVESSVMLTSDEGLYSCTTNLRLALGKVELNEVKDDKINSSMYLGVGD